ncbi:hypothetical protein HDU93_001800 [Gonapodya sp. JEL0774]|nr:hypothetical protein HDU93_001800 [Gonapodya sp. JEL0774]
MLFRTGVALHTFPRPSPTPERKKFPKGTGTFPAPLSKVCGTYRVFLKARKYLGAATRAIPYRMLEQSKKIRQEAKRKSVWGAEPGDSAPNEKLSARCRKVFSTLV